MMHFHVKIHQPWWPLVERKLAGALRFITERTSVGVGVGVGVGIGVGVRIRVRFWCPNVGREPML